MPAVEPLILPPQPPTAFAAVERWGDKAVACWHPDHGGWAWHHADYGHGGRERPRMIRLVPPTPSEVSDAIDDCRRLVMAFCGGNLDHPALDHLEQAMLAIADVAGPE